MQVEWASVQTGEDSAMIKTQKFSVLFEAAAEGWGPQAGCMGWTPPKEDELANADELSVSSSLICSLQPKSAGPV